MSVVELVVDNRVFLLGLDELYRTVMKRHERDELLDCARRVARTLDVEPADVPIEGYYTEEPALSLYFRLMKALQHVPLDRAREVEPLPEFQRLLQVTSSPIFGQPMREHVLPVSRDPLSAALAAIQDPAEWSVPLLTKLAGRIARDNDDYSLVGLAALAEDCVVLSAHRESAVLYAEMLLGASYDGPLPRFTYVWRVDPALAAAAERFVSAFNALIEPGLPAPKVESVQRFWNAAQGADVEGRCVQLGTTLDTPPRYYHRAICQDLKHQLAVDEFWDEEVWTTQRYLHLRRRGPLGQVHVLPDSLGE